MAVKLYNGTLVRCLSWSVMRAGDGRSGIDKVSITICDISMKMSVTICGGPICYPYTSTLLLVRVLQKSINTYNKNNLQAKNQLNYHCNIIYHYRQSMGDLDIHL